MQDTLLSEIDRTAISDIIESDSIYRYPEETLHFSLVNFETRIGIPRETFEYQLSEKIEQIKKSLKDHPILTKLEFRPQLYLYPRAGEDKAETIAVNGSLYFNGKELSRDELEVKIKDVLALSVVVKKLKIPPSVINIIRLFKDINPSEEMAFNSCIDEINKNLRKGNFKFNLQYLSVVISNNYLSNFNPEVAKIALY